MSPETIKNGIMPSPIDFYIENLSQSRIIHSRVLYHSDTQKYCWLFGRGVRKWVERNGLLTGSPVMIRKGEYYHGDKRFPPGTMVYRIKVYPINMEKFDELKKTLISE